MSTPLSRPMIERLYGKERQARTELGLELLLASRLPGATFSRNDIALWCGCTDVAIELIEKNALRKLRKYSSIVLREL